MKRQIFFAFLVIALFSVSAWAQARKFDVSLNIQASSSQLKDTVESYVARELRSLGDVNIVTQGFYEIRILIMETKVGGRVAGYTLSTVVNWRATCKSSNASTTFPCYVFDDHFLNVASLDSLREACGEIVTDFDTRSLKPLRPANK